jgi:hypothetical protein
LEVWYNLVSNIKNEFDGGEIKNYLGKAAQGRTLQRVIERLKRGDEEEGFSLHREIYQENI